MTKLSLNGSNKEDIMLVPRELKKDIQPIGPLRESIRLGIQSAELLFSSDSTDSRAPISKSLPANLDLIDLELKKITEISEQNKFDIDNELKKISEKILENFAQKGKTKEEEALLTKVAPLLIQEKEFSLAKVEALRKSLRKKQIEGSSLSSNPETIFSKKSARAELAKIEGEVNEITKIGEMPRAAIYAQLNEIRKAISNDPTLCAQIDRIEKCLRRKPAEVATSSRNSSLTLGS